jgi:RNA polymerase primary sigma factor
MRGQVDRDAAGELIRQYLGEIGSYPLLTAADEVDLAEQMELGRRAADALEAGVRPAERKALEQCATAGALAKRRFIQSNLRLVVSIAKRYQSAGLPLLDLIQEGNLGLIRAVERFEPDRGCKFSTYATWWVRQSIGRAVADKGRTIRVPSHMLDNVRRVNSAAARLRDGLGREGTVDEVARDAGMSVAAVVDARRLLPDSISLHLPLGEGEGELADLIEDRDAEIPFERAASALRTDAVRAAIETLPEREQRVLSLRFGLGDNTPRTLEQVGRDFRLTRERIRQIEAKALTRLRHPAGPRGLRAHMERTEDPVAAGGLEPHAVS